VLDEVVADLLQAVGEYGSLVAAARSRAMPHRTAWKRVQLVEASVGVKLVETRSGGITGGHSRLTPRAQKLLQCYWSARAGLDDLVGERWSAGCSPR
jgi:molybdate transport system regulatory protein